MSMLSLKTMDEAYQMALKAEEKLLRKQSARGKGTFRGKGSQGGRGGSTAHKTGASSSSRQQTSSDGDAGGRISFSRGRGGRGRGREFRCYKCNKVGHRSYECHVNEGTNQRNVIVTPIERGSNKSSRGTEYTRERRIFDDKQSLFKTRKGSY